MAIFESLNQVRYLSGDGHATTAYAITMPADGMFTGKAALLALGCPVFALGAQGEESGGERLKGIRIVPFGKGADGDTFVFRVYAAHFLGGEGNGQRGPVQLVLLATVTCTMGNALGTSGGMLTTTERIVDTISVSKSAYLTALETRMELANGAGAYSPADNTQGCCWIPDCGNAAGIVIDTDLGAATAANYLLQRDI